MPNRVGTAPGVWYRFKDTDFYFMPGVPREMKALFQKQILPEVLEKIDGGLHFETCFLKTFGSTESQLDAKLSDLQSGRSKIQNARIGFRFHFPEIMLKVSVWDEDAAKAKKDHARVLAQIKERVGEFIYAEDEKTSLENVVVHKLSQNKKTCAFAESCTGGLISSRLTNVPGASEVFVGGVVSYSNELKQKLLGVSEDILKSEGAVSELCAKAMVEGLHQKTGADFCAAVTGIAGPSGGSPEKPVGTVFIATLCDGHLKVKRHNFSFPRTMFKEIVASVVFKKFLEAMSS
ncbi:MAG: nicotinamide-nucleotide amidohydrolase family protein [Deltaproteobacteria bacterium]|nr:nicotinamide-nucleotide amidohydrolase family protein [Deltaproteobacteria bacterium]